MELGSIGHSTDERSRSRRPPAGPSLFHSLTDAQCHNNKQNAPGHGETANDDRQHRNGHEMNMNFLSSCGRHVSPS